MRDILKIGCVIIILMACSNIIWANEETPLKIEMIISGGAEGGKYFTGEPISVDLMIGWAENEAGNEAERNCEKKEFLVGTKDKPWYKNIRFHIRKVSDKEWEEIISGETTAKGNWLKNFSNEELSLKDIVYDKERPHQIRLRKYAENDQDISKWITPEQTTKLGVGKYILLVSMNLILNVDGKYRDITLETEAIFQLVQPKNDDDRANILGGLSWYYGSMGLKDKEIEALEKSLTLNPKSFRGYNGLGRLYERAKKYEFALRAYENGLTAARASNEPPPGPTEMRMGRDDFIRDFETSIKRVKEIIAKQKDKPKDSPDKSGQDDANHSGDKPSGQEKPPDKK